MTVGAHDAPVRAGIAQPLLRVAQLGDGPIVARAVHFWVDGVVGKRVVAIGGSDGVGGLCGGGEDVGDGGGRCAGGVGEHHDCLGMKTGECGRRGSNRGN